MWIAHAATFHGLQPCKIRKREAADRKQVRPASPARGRSPYSDAQALTAFGGDGYGFLHLLWNQRDQLEDRPFQFGAVRDIQPSFGILIDGESIFGDMDKRIRQFDVLNSWPRNELVVGIGSPHGEDQVGWLVAKRIASRVNSDRIDVRLARTPSKLIDWLPGVARLIVCDACRGIGRPGALRRWQWPALSEQGVTWSGTHDLSLPAVLALAASLGPLPPETIIWGVEIAEADPQSTISAAVWRAVPELSKYIVAELRRGHPAVGQSGN
jgi:hydrogenase maturation protease